MSHPAARSASANGVAAGSQAGHITHYSTVFGWFDFVVDAGISKRLLQPLLHLIWKRLIFGASRYNLSGASIASRPP